MIPFEYHITIDGNLDEWVAFCHEQGIKPLDIRLTEGDCPRQLMCAHSFLSPTASLALGEAEHMLRCVRSNFAVKRLKLEAMLDKIPEMGAGARVLYYEAHMKLILPPNSEADTHRLATRLELAASRNVLYEGNEEKWYLTSRLPGGTDYQEAGMELTRRLAEVAEYRPTVRMEMEAVLIDTNPGLDNGWVTIHG
jgi:hypothetical protein